jgi:hypothetical protein
MNRPKSWTPLSVGNPIKTSIPFAGALRLDLKQVASGWPYEYQWGGAFQRLKVDIARFPVLCAKVSQLLGGYAHMDVDVLNAAGEPVKSLRSSTLQAGGVTAIDLSSDLDPAVYTLEVRLMVGGSNAGCWATYNWVRFTTVKGGKWLAKYPNWPAIHLAK